MEINDLTYAVRGCLFRVHTQLGPGLLESIYEEALAFEFNKNHIPFKTQIMYPVYYDEIKLDKEFKLDMLIDNQLIIELKSVDVLSPVHYKQLLTYLKITRLKIGLLVNFNVENMQSGINRVVYKL
ncbi:MAG: GxxExxY protein [Bacteroidia bacterium]|nr:GxxExxY protein [Bacteroidia bacterium]